MIELAQQYGRYGYRKIAALLRDAGWLVSDTRIERIWRREGLKVPQKQPKRGRLWLTDGSCIRLRPEHSNHVWSYDFVEDRTHDGRKYRMLNVIDEFTHECLAIRINRKLKAIDVIDVLSDLFILRGVAGHIRSDNGPEFVAKAVRYFRHSYRPNRFRDRPTLRGQHVNLPQLRDDLFSRVSLSLAFFSPPSGHKPYIREDHFSGGRPRCAGAVDNTTGCSPVETSAIAADPLQSARPWPRGPRCSMSHGAGSASIRVNTQ